MPFLVRLKSRPLPIRRSIIQKLKRDSVSRSSRVALVGSSEFVMPVEGLAEVGGLWPDKEVVLVQNFLLRQLLVTVRVRFENLELTFWTANLYSRENLNRKRKSHGCPMKWVLDRNCPSICFNRFVFSNMELLIKKRRRSIE